MKSDSWPGEWEPASSGDPGADADDSRLSRRTLLGGAASFFALAGAGGAGLMVLTDRASADVATGGLNISGDSTLSDGGQLTSLTVSINDGHVSYDGLDTDAASVEINLFAAKAGNSTDTSANRIGQKTKSVGTNGLDTRAGHADYSFSGVDVLASDDLTTGYFASPTDGNSTNSDVDFRVELVVRDSGGTNLVEAQATQTVTITVNNEARSADVNGTGSTAATGANQEP